MGIATENQAGPSEESLAARTHWVPGPEAGGGRCGAAASHIAAGGNRHCECDHLVRGTRFWKHRHLHVRPSSPSIIRLSMELRATDTEMSGLSVCLRRSCAAPRCSQTSFKIRILLFAGTAGFDLWED